MTMGVTERILKNVTELYVGGSTGVGGAEPGAIGLKSIAEDPLLGLSLHKPRKKVTVMIVGNHSAGKSSFINWYIGETIQKTGVAIETKGFSFLTSGKKRETLKGPATLHFFDHLKGFDQFDGIVQSIATEVSSSKEKDFPCVDFIDTPGLVDGDVLYSFDVDGAIVWLADHVDLVLVFFDPIGQALTARTMNVIARLAAKHNDKLRFYMSKADQVEREDDRQRVLIQITQNVTTRIKCTHAFALPTFYLPYPPDDLRPPPAIPNAIQEVCEEINKAIRLTVQKNLETVRTDCQAIAKRIQEVLVEGQGRRDVNRTRRNYGIVLSLVSWLVLATLLVVVLRQVIAQAPMLSDLLDNATAGLPPYLAFLHTVLGLDSEDGDGREPGLDVESDHHHGARLVSRGFATRTGQQQSSSGVELYWVLGILGALYISLVIATKVVWTYLPVLSKRDLSRLKAHHEFVERVNKIREDLYKDYFRQLQVLD